jgi:hypothetical protein
LQAVFSSTTLGGIVADVIVDVTDGPDDDEAVIEVAPFHLTCAHNGCSQVLLHAFNRVPLEAGALRVVAHNEQMARLGQLLAIWIWFAAYDVHRERREGRPLPMCRSSQMFLLAWPLFSAIRAIRQPKPDPRANFTTELSLAAHALPTYRGYPIGNLAHLRDGTAAAQA